MRLTSTAMILLALAGCTQQAASYNEANMAANDDVTAPVISNEVPPSAPAPTQAPASPAQTPAPKPAPDQHAPGQPGGLPDDRTPLNEPHGAIDPKSSEAAGQVVQQYGALLEERKFAAARRLWGGKGEASGLTEAQFIAAYDKYAELHSEVGKPGDSEGAAGSIYVDVPFRLFGKLKTGKPFNLLGPLSLRRVNDVDGSTAEQRRWHIFQSGLKPRP